MDREETLSEYVDRLEYNMSLYKDAVDKAIETLFLMGCDKPFDTKENIKAYLMGRETL